MDDAAAADTNPFAAMDPEMAANPQPVFSALRDSMPVMPVDGVGVVVSRRAEIEEIFRDPATFSSNMDAVDLKNARPLIPLQIDPPEHKKYRKILDPIFAPREMALIAEPVAQLANELIDGFIDRDGVDFAREFSVPFPSLVFLTLLGLPLDQLARFVEMKDGIIRPDQVTGTPYGSEEMQAYQQATADSIYEYFEEVLDEREAEPRDDLLSRFLAVEVDGEALKRTEILDICFLFLIAGLDTVTATLDCMFAYLAQHPEQRRLLVEDPELIPGRDRGVAALGDAGARRGARRDPGHRARRLSDSSGRPGLGHLELRQHRPRGVRRSGHDSLRSPHEPPLRVRRRAPPLPRIAPRPPGAADRAARVAPAHPRLLGRARPHTRVHARDPIDRPLPDGLRPEGVLTTTRRGRSKPLPTRAGRRPRRALRE